MRKRDVFVIYSHLVTFPQLDLKKVGSQRCHYYYVRKEKFSRQEFIL